MSPNLKHTRSGSSIIDEEDEQPPAEGDSSARRQTGPHERGDGEARARQRSRARHRIQSTPVNPLLEYIPLNLRNFVIPYHGDFCVAPVFDARLISQLMVEGFLPIATDGFLLPKLHVQRSVIHLPDDLHVSKSSRKKAKRFRPTFDQAFYQVVAGCRQQHGPQCWLYPPLVKAFASIQKGMLVQVRDGSSNLEHCPVRLHSMELWDESDRLVAGELGYTVGSIYTSLTGFTNQDSAGSVQLVTLGRLLCQYGFKLWDMGMDMEYKRTLGAQLMPRDSFVSFVRQVRVKNSHLKLPELCLEHQDGSLSCRDYIDGQGSASDT